jgi:hypothetical protein
VDRTSRVTELQSLHVYLQTTIVPVLSSAIQITATLDKLSRDVWLEARGLTAFGHPRPG